MLGPSVEAMPFLNPVPWLSVPTCEAPCPLPLSPPLLGLPSADSCYSTSENHGSGVTLMGREGSFRKDSLPG